MPNTKISKFDPDIPTQFREWFGTPAVLTADDQRLYDQALCGVFNDVRPKGFIPCMLIEELAHLLSERSSLRRLRSNLIRRAHNEKFEPMERELLQDAERRKGDIRRVHNIFGPRTRRPGGRDPLTDTKFATECEISEAKLNEDLAAIDAETNQKLAELQKAKDAAPIDEAATFDRWIDAVERVEKRMEVVERNILITQKLLDEHRTGLGQRLRASAEEIVDVEFAERPAGEEAIARAEAPRNTEVKKESRGPMTASSVSELSSPTSAKANGGEAIQLDAPAAAARPPSSGPTEQQ
jgi:hypothetical protein